MSLIKLRLSMIGTLAFIIGFSTLVFTVLLNWIGGFSMYTVIAFVILINIVQWLLAPAMIGGIYRVKEVSEREQPSLHRMVDKICSRTGFKKPKVMIADIPMANAFAYGSPLSGPRVAVTTGLMNNLEEEEVEAVIGHEIGHLKHRDVQIMMFASVLPAIFYYIGFSFMMSGMFRGRDRNTGGAVLIGIAAMAVYWILSLLVLGLSRLREYYADQHAVRNVDDGARKMSEALAKIATSETRVMQQGKTAGVSAFKTLFINDPDTAKGDTDIISSYSRRLGDRELVEKIRSRKLTGFNHLMEIFSTHPNMVKRLKALQKAG